MDWIVVKDTGRESDILRLIAAVENAGLKAYTPTIKQILDSDLRECERGLPSDSCIVYGTISATKELVERGHIAWFGKTNCTDYYPRFGDWLMQAGYEMLPIGDLNRKWNWIYDQIGIDNHLFVRPNENNKLFTAKCIEKRDCVYFSRAGIDPSTLIVVSHPRVILKEYRLFFKGTKYLTGSLYKEEGKLNRSPDVPESLIKTASGIAKHCHYAGLPPIWCLDLAETPHDYNGIDIRVLEVSGVNCAGWYEADYDILVREITETADALFQAV